MKKNVFHTFFYAGIFFFLWACGSNLYKGFSAKKNNAYHSFEARKLIDEEKYAEALDELAKLEGASDEKETLLLRVSAQLGQSGLSLWKILLDIIDSQSSSKNGESGIDKVFNVLTSSVFGEGEERGQRVTALSEAIKELEASGLEDSRIDNFRCFLAGVLFLPVLEDGTTAVKSMTDALTSLSQSVVGDGASAAQCPSLDSFNTAVADLTFVQSNLSLSLKQALGCAIFDSLNSKANLNEIETKLQKFIDAADKGCVVLTCPASDKICAALQFGCVKTLLGSTAQAGDKKVEVCEIVQNCRNPKDCF
ncbi:MAG: hypothetical protein KA436_07970 [Oligoflexales bacterium]|nr:hypothetical protein [Oligoflexales bacterium]